VTPQAGTAVPDALVDPEFHASGDPHAVWRWMRAHAPVHRHETPELPPFWSLTRYDDIRAAYRDHRVLSSASGVLLRPAKHGTDPGGGRTLALADPPRHGQLRALVADWFNTRAVRLLDRSMRAAVRAVLARVVEQGECDFVHDVAGRLSMYVIGHIMGVPERDHEALFEWTNEAFEAGRSLVQSQQLMAYFIDLMDLRGAEPRDDLVSSLVHGTVDGEPLSEYDVLLNCENIVGATENGRLALAGGVLAFLRHPEQWRRLAADRGLLPGAVEEVLRWTSSATHSMRTATEPVVIHGQRIEAGERVVLWVPSANRDEAVFTDADSFDITRQPNRHLAFGGGEHFCVGSTLARAQLRVLYSELLDTAAALEQTGPALPVHSIAVTGPESLPMRIHPK